MKLPKKELASIVPTFQYWQDDPDHQEFFDGMKMVLSQLGVLTQIQNEIFIKNHPKIKEQIKTTEQLIRKAYPKNTFDCHKLNEYHDDIPYMMYLSNADKTTLDACLKYISSIYPK